MSDTVIYNGVSYDVERIILMKGVKAQIDTSKQTNVENAVCSSKIKYPIVIPVDGGYYTLIKPAVEAKNPSVAFVLSKFILKKLRDTPVTDARPYTTGFAAPVQNRLVYQQPYGQRQQQSPVVENHRQPEQPIRAIETAPKKLTGIEVLRERARIQQQEYQHQQRSSN